MHRYLFAIILLLACASAPARAQTTICTQITTIPTTISAQGVYCMRQDLSTSIGTGAAISVNANNVTIDCNGFKLGGLAAGNATQANGIYASGTRSNVTIRNCNVRGFHTGIHLGQVCGSCSSSGLLVEHNLLDNNTKQGIYVAGENSIARNNRVLNTGGSILGGQDVVGIHATGSPAFVLDNIVSGTFGPSFAADTVGIRYTGFGSIGRGNLVSQTTPGSNGTAAGIAAGGTGINVFSNIVVNASATLDYGIDTTYGSTLCRDNTVRGATNVYDGCLNGGGNYPAP